MRSFTIGFHAAVIVLSVVFAGCGGGGGGGGGGSSVPTLTYTGNSSAAVITSSNASGIASAVLGGDPSGSVGLFATSASAQTIKATSATGDVSIVKALGRTASLLKKSDSAHAVAAVAIDELDPCDSGVGTIHITGTLSDSGLGTLDVSYNGCLLGVLTVNGQGTLRIDAFDLVNGLPIDSTTTVPNLSVTGVGVDRTVGGSVRTQINLGARSQTTTSNVVTKDNASNKMTKSENFVIVDVFNPSVTTVTETLNGRFFRSDIGFVDVNTTVSFFFGTVSQLRPDSGNIRFIGAGNGSIRLTVLSQTSITIELDLDGDSAFDISVKLTWVDLSGPVGADLGDSDGDGMHDSWETAHGLNPNDPSDASQDADGDGVSNLDEYLGGTDPTNSSSHPAATDLAVSMTDSSDPVLTNSVFTYSLTISNLGSTTALNLHLEDTLPAGTTLASISAGSWSCSAQAGVVSCSLPSLTPGSTSNLLIHVNAPASAGGLQNTATVSSDLLETNSANNTAIEQTTVVVPTTDLSISVSDSADPVPLGLDFTYTIAVTNTGMVSATNVQVADTLPAGTAFVSASGAGWNCSHNAGVVTCTRGTLAAGPASTIALVVTAPSSPGTISNTATVSSDTPDSNNANDSATQDTTIIVPTADLGVSISARDTLTLGSKLTYTITVSNTGGFTATNVELTDTPPAGAALISSNSSQGSCAGSNPVTCNIGSLNALASATVTIVVQPAAEGVVQNAASVTSDLLDTNAANDSATKDTTVTQVIASGTLADIQTKIGDAVAGDTIFVAPGTYTGSLNFLGKDVSLISQNGAAATTINGNLGIAVVMGPGGTIRGFTITGASGDSGAGIQVHGVGTLISENIFDGNAQTGGGFGAAIGGNNASATIERNIFRNNTCDTQFLSGVVAFVNSSSPIIVNNVFENNPCRAINLLGHLPRVINNTIVGNRTGVRADLRGDQHLHVYRNNIIFQNDVGLETEFGTVADNPVWQNNLVFGNTTNYQGTPDLSGSAGNISSDPLLVNSASGDYHLQSSSPAIDAGSSVDAPTVDFDGMSRPIDGDGTDGAAFDIGAFEAAAPP